MTAAETYPLPDRDEVRKAWKPFQAKYSKYLNEENWAAWFMQDKIVHAYMTGRLREEGEMT